MALCGVRGCVNLIFSHITTVMTWETDVSFFSLLSISIPPFSLSVNIKRFSILPIKLASKVFAIRHVLELLVICPWFIAI